MKLWYDRNYVISYPIIRGEPRNIYYPAALEPKADGSLAFSLYENNSCVMVNKDEYGCHRADFPVLDEITTLGLKSHIVAGELHTGKDFYDFERNKKSDELKFAVFGVWEFKKEGNYYKPKYRVKYKDMRAELEKLFAKRNFKYAHLVESVLAHNLKELEKIRDDYIRRGFEGAVAKNLNSTWANGDTKEWIKLKAEHTADLVILGYSKKAKYLSLYLGYKNNGKWQGLCGCGSGLKYAEKMRIKTLLEKDKLPKHQQLCRGNILVKPKYVAEITYQQLIKDKAGRITSLRHPIYKRLRNEKSIDEVSFR